MPVNYYYVLLKYSSPDAWTWEEREKEKLVQVGVWEGHNLVAPTPADF